MSRPEHDRPLIGWLQKTIGTSSFELNPISNDASFRRYWRLTYDGDTKIVMDAPPDKEDCHPFINISRRLLAAGLNVPEVLAHDLDQGFLLLTDLGEALYLNILNPKNAEQLYADAIERLLTMQTNVRLDHLPRYDRELLEKEMELFDVWLVNKELGITLSQHDREVLDRTFAWLAAQALSQPQVFVHRDYHSRNLLYTPHNNPGILDFQGAVIGPVTYDLVSLLRDCYIRWPPEQVQEWALRYYGQAQRVGIIVQADVRLFLRWFDLMGVQRHLKASGIFARLYHRDGKSRYLGDVPRTLNYIIEVSTKYPELTDLHHLLTEIIMPAIEDRAAL